jgi:O-methyltransferase involved in polyketide biosynthesis
MKNVIKTTLVAATFAATVGATSVNAATIEAKPAAFSTEQMITYMNEETGYSVIESVKDVLRPVKNYFFQSEAKTFNGVPIHQACVRISTNGSTSIFTFGR